MGSEFGESFVCGPLCCDMSKTHPARRATRDYLGTSRRQKGTIGPHLFSFSFLFPHSPLLPPPTHLSPRERAYLEARQLFLLLEGNYIRRFAHGTSFVGRPTAPGFRLITKLSQRYGSDASRKAAAFALPPGHHRKTTSRGSLVPEQNRLAPADGVLRRFWSVSNDGTLTTAVAEQGASG